MYDLICNQMHDLESLNLSEYFQTDLPVIHRIAVGFYFFKFTVENTLF
jgi:hypothetical protein